MKIQQVKENPLAGKEEALGALEKVLSALRLENELLESYLKRFSATALGQVS